MAKKLYGTDPDQVPTNADLGTMAYQDKDNASISKIDAPDGGEMLINSRNSNGDVIIGNTVVNPTSGFSAQKGFGYDGSTGTVEIATNANQAAMQLGKNNANDGKTLVFRKQGTELGSIGSSNSGYNLFITTSDTGLAFNYLADEIVPCTANGAYRDAAIDLGDSTARFKDLYLSGGVVFGDAGGSGTPTSNTLDSYEEGSWSPNVAGATTAGSYSWTATQAGVYTKVGKLVTVNCALIDCSVSTAGSGTLLITGLPFSVRDTAAMGRGATGSIHIRQLGTAISSSARDIYVYGNRAGTDVYVLYNDGTNDQGVPVTTLTSGSDIGFTLTYETD